MRFNAIQPFLIATLISSLFLVSACSPQKEEADHGATESADVSDEVKEQIETKAIKAFPKTENDAHDIALLETYEKDFNAMSTDLENELEQLKKEGTLSNEMNHQRKRDLIQSSLNMLKELDLKTEQGRYIQGLFYQYWENQIGVYTELEKSSSDELQDPTDAVKGMGDYYTAKAQLKHWKAQ